MTLVSPSSAQWNEARLSDAALAPKRMYPIHIAGPTNLALWSEDFSNAAWTSQTSNVAVLTDQATGDDGTLTADKLTFSGSGSAYRYQTYNLGSPIVGRTFTWSVWVWSPSKATMGLRINNSLNGADASVVRAALSTHLLRFSVTRTFTGTGNFIDFGFDNRDLGGGLPGDGIDGFIYAWGGMLEESATPSTYVKTTTASAVGAGVYGFTDSSTGLAFTPNSDGSLSINASPGADAIQLVQLGSGSILFPG